MVPYRLYEVSETAPLVIFTHGIGEYGMLYEGFAKALNQAGYAVVLYDVRGHGSSVPLGVLKSYKHLMDDLDEILLKEKKNRKVYLIGHSLGALISHLYTVSRPGITGVVSIGYHYHRIFALKWLGFLLPNKKLYLNWADKRSRHEKTEAEIHDPMLLKYVTYKMVSETIDKANQIIHNQLKSYPADLLVIHGGSDQIVPIDNAYALYDRAHTKSKEILIYPDSYHDVLFDIDQTLVIKDIIDWLNLTK